MTQTIDIAHAEAPELRRLLAELPCAEAYNHQYMEGMPEGGGQPDGAICADCKEAPGLALPWASTQCHHGAIIDDVGVRWEQDKCPICNGSGRVPKAVGLEKLFEHGGLTLIRRRDLGRTKQDVSEKFLAVCGTSASMFKGKTPLLAALRAVAKALMR